MTGDGEVPAAGTDPRGSIDRAPMGRAQIVAIAIVTALSALDGYDLLSVTFAAPAILKDWSIGKDALGIVLASSLFGVALGSLALAPFADLIGRRKMVVVNLVVMAIGMALSASARSVPTLAAWRVVTGVGIGSMVPIILPLAAEYANDRRRALSMAMMTIGYPMGGMIGGVAASLLLRAFGWPEVFLFGSAIAVMLIPIVLLWLPEPLAFLLERRDANSLVRVNAVLRRFGHPPVDALPAAVTSGPRTPYRAIFAGDQRGATLHMTLVNFLFVLATYFILSWLPQLVAELSFAATVGASMSSLSSMAGVVACIAINLFPARRSQRIRAALLMAGLGLATALFGVLPAAVPALAVGAVAIGACLFGATAALFATLVATFAPGMRATGIGFVTGVGRIGAGLAPASAGFLFAAGATRGTVTAAFGAAAVLAALLMLIRRTR